MHSAFNYSANVPKNKPLRVVLGENVAGVMKAKRLSQPKVAANAKRAGTPIDQTTISRVSRAVYPATIDTLEAIANGLGIDPWQLLMPELNVQAIKLSDGEIAQIEQAKRALENLTPAQRDMFIKDGLVRDLLSRAPYPDEKLGTRWTRPDKRPLVSVKEPHGARYVARKRRI